MSCHRRILAGRRDLLESIPFFTGYGVEIAMLVEVWGRVGLGAMAQVQLGTKRNSHQSLAALNLMAAEVIDALASTLQRLAIPGAGVIQAAEGVESKLLVRDPHSAAAPVPLSDK